MALRLGVSHTPTAAAAVCALEAWYADIPCLLEPYLHMLLPKLDPYLRGASGGALTGGSAASLAQAALEGVSVHSV